jgi:RNA polymerase sigma-70 factor (ECF subfamily)
MATATLEQSMTPVDLVRAHQAEIWRYLRFLGCDPSRADDLAQEVFVAVLAKPPQRRSEGETRAYLRTVARHKFLMLVRKHERGAKEVELTAAEAVWGETHPRDGGDGNLEALDDCLAKLDGRAKEAIDLHYRQQRSRAEIAAALEMTEDGVKSLLRRTREILRQCVEAKVKASGSMIVGQ